MFDFIGTSELKRFNSSQNEILVRRLQFSQTSKIVVVNTYPPPLVLDFPAAWSHFVGFVVFLAGNFRWALSV